MIAKHTTRKTNRENLLAGRVLIPVSVMLLFAFLAAQPDLSMSIPLVVGISGIIVVLLALALFLAAPYENPWSPLVIMGVAVLLRLMFVCSPPVLSNDLYRYLIDGLAMLKGVSPYAMPPMAADFLAADTAFLVPLVNHNHMITIYPPAAQTVFAAGAAMGSIIGPLAGMKLVLTAMDVCSCFIMMSLLRSMKIPTCRVILYAWNPLPVLEIAGSGHIDGAAVCFLVAALAMAIRPGKGLLTGFFMALAILTKWVPIMFVPAWFLLVPTGKRTMSLVTLLSAGTALMALFWPELINGFKTLGLYLQHWEFSGFIFRSLRQVTGSGGIARLICAATFTGIVGALFMKQRSAPDGPTIAFGCCAAVSGAYLVLAPTVYPWYALYLSAFLPFVHNPGPLILTWSVMLSYRVLIARNASGLWIEDDVTPLMIMIGPAIAMGIHSHLNVTSPGPD